MIHEKLYDSLIATPVSAEDAVAGDIAWATFRGMVSGTLMMARRDGHGGLPGLRAQPCCCSSSSWSSSGSCSVRWP